MYYNMMKGKNMKRCMKSTCIIGAMIIGFKLGYMVCKKQIKSALSL
jgi:ABC-type cobalt transport system substrate-binding protein